VDNTDVYAFLSPDQPNTATVIANFYPDQSPAGGPNFFQFDPKAHYDANIDTNGDAKKTSSTAGRSTRRSRTRTRSYTTPGR